MKYTVVIIKEDEWYAGFIKELPGANSQGKTALATPTTQNKKSRR